MVEPIDKMKQGATKMCNDTRGADGGKLAEVYNCGTTRLIITASGGDKYSSAKIKGIKAGVKRVQAKGYDLPAIIEIVTVATDGVQTVAYQRDSEGARKATIVIGKSVQPDQIFNLPIGIATELTPDKKKTDKLVEAVTVHEIGHILHDLKDGGFFWSAEGDAVLQGPEINIAAGISPYAAQNRKEYVAEFFTCHVYGHKIDATANDAGALAQYNRFNGPDLN
jgi:hypothetical protein